MFFYEDGENNCIEEESVLSSENLRKSVKSSKDAFDKVSFILAISNMGVLLSFLDVL